MGDYNKLKSLKVAQKHGCPGVVYDYMCDVACDGEGIGMIDWWLTDDWLTDDWCNVVCNALCDVVCDVVHDVVRDVVCDVVVSGVVEWLI